KGSFAPTARPRVARRGSPPGYAHGRDKGKVYLRYNKFTRPPATATRFISGWQALDQARGDFRISYVETNVIEVEELHRETVGQQRQDYFTVCSDQPVMPSRSAGRSRTHAERG